MQAEKNLRSVRIQEDEMAITTRTGLSRKNVETSEFLRNQVKRITMKMIFARNGKHNTRKQEAEGRESFNRMSGHVFRGGSGSQLPGHLCKSWLEPAELSALCTPF